MDAEKRFEHLVEGKLRVVLHVRNGRCGYMLCRSLVPAFGAMVTDEGRIGSIVKRNRSSRTIVP